VDPPIFLYDGDCGFCTSTVRLIQRFVPSRARFQPWQRSDLDALGVPPAACEEAVQWVDATGYRSGPDAVAAMLRDAGGRFRPVGYLLDHPPLRWLAGPVYRWISRHRHQLPGGTPACAIR
jgi:predicted DCC family thiol-disulfide oxidoreductase YuxK